MTRPTPRPTALAALPPDLLNGLGDPAALARRSAPARRPPDHLPARLRRISPWTAHRILTPASGRRSALALRRRALEVFLADVYGEQRTSKRASSLAVRWRSRRITSRDARGAGHSAGSASWVSTWCARPTDAHVIEDQVRMPSGLAYAVAAREERAICCRCRPRRPTSRGPTKAGLGAARGGTAGRSRQPRMVLLCEGREAAAW